MFVDSAIATSSAKIAIVGSGHVGLVAAACFGEMGHAVTCVDSHETKLADLRAGMAPIRERVLPELLARQRDVSLTLTADLPAAVEPAEAISVAVGTTAMECGAAPCETRGGHSVALPRNQRKTGMKVATQLSGITERTSFGRFREGLWLY